MKARGVIAELTRMMAAAAVITLAAAAGMGWLAADVAGRLRRTSVESSRRAAALLQTANAVAGVQTVTQRLLREKDVDALEKLIASGKEHGARAEAQIQGAGVEATVGKAYASLEAANRRALEKLLVGDYAQAQEVYLADSNRAFDEVMGGLGQAQEAATGRSEAEMAEAMAGARRRAFWIAGPLLAGLGLMTLLSVRVVRRMKRTLRAAVGELGGGIERIAAAASQVSSASQGLAGSASQQAATVEETSASAEEIRSMTERNADNSRQAAERMRQSAGDVAAADRLLGDMVQSMEALNESSGRISRIIKVIDEIAFQTNILALNAAVEAARAGEAGMGFAVVAEEVRNLAQRSAAAARDTAALIDESIARSREGAGKLDQVAGAIRGVTAGARDAAALVEQVRAASVEQSQGIGLVSQAVSRIETITQSTAASAQQSAEASREMHAQTTVLLGVASGLQALIDGSGPGRER